MWSTLNIGSSGLKAAQKLIDVSSHNIANADTPGYKKSEGSTNEIAFKVQSDLQFGGAGTEARVTKPNEPWVDRRYQLALQEKAMDDARKEGIDEIESATTNASVSTAYDEFFNAASQLQRNPNDVSLKEKFNQSGKALADGMNSLSNDFKSIQDDLQQKVDFHQMRLDSLKKTLSELTSKSNTKDVVAEVNYVTQQISQETGTISGYNAVLQKVIPPLTGLYDRAKEESISNINSSYGRTLFDTNNDGQVSWTNAQGGNIQSLVNSDKEVFSNELSRLNVIVGVTQEAATNVATFGTNNLQSANEDYNRAYGVDLVEESVKMKRAQQLYEANAQAIKTDDQMFQALMNIFV